MEHAREGSLYSYLRRAAYFVRERQDPTELFLSGIPKSAASITLAYPERVPRPELLAHLRQLAHSEQPVHSRTFYKHSLIMLPFLPLALSPFPNAPLYYAWYRMYCSNLAFHGASALVRLLPESPNPRNDDPDADSDADSTQLPECTRLHLLSQSGSTHQHPPGSVCCRAQSNPCPGIELVPCRVLQEIESTEGLAKPTEKARGPRTVADDAGLQQEQIEAIERTCGASGVGGTSVRIMHADRRRRGKGGVISQVLGR